MLDLFGPTVTVHVGNESLTSDRVRTILGWQEVKSKRESHFRDSQGKYVCLKYAHHIRSLDMATVRWLAGDIAKGFQRFNGEGIVVGRSGQVLAGIELAVAFVLASQATDCRLETLLVKGVEEGDDVYRTLHVARPLNVADVLYRSERLADLGRANRDRCAKALEEAIRLLWDRIGVTGPWTVCTATDWLDRHSRLIEAIRYLLDLFAPKQEASRWLSLGHAGSLLWLMGCGASQPAAYQGDEQSLDWTQWDRAQDFWRWCSGAQVFADVRRPSESGRGWGEYLFAEGEGSEEERASALLCAWSVWRDGETPGSADCTPEYESDGERLVLVPATAGGIDREPEAIPEDGNEDTPDLPSAAEIAEIEQRKRDVLRDKLLAMRQKEMVCE